MNKVFAYRGIETYEELEGMYDAGELAAIFSLIGEAVQPGDNVVLKPNFVKESHLDRHDEWVQIVTNGSLVKCVLKEVVKALRGVGHIAVVDAPRLIQTTMKSLSV